MGSALVLRSLDAETAEIVTVLGFFVALLLSLGVNVRDRVAILKKGER